MYIFSNAKSSNRTTPRQLVTRFVKAFLEEEAIADETERNHRHKDNSHLLLLIAA